MSAEHRNAGLGAPDRTPSFATGDHTLELAIFTAHPQESVIEATAIEDVIRFPQDEARKRLYLDFEVGANPGYWVSMN